jgi:hypothetical protein
LGVTLYQNDCVSAPDASLAFINSTTGDELDVELDIIQETISPSTTSTSGTAAIIGFCLRVDYNYVDGDGFTESINFYETNVTITVDLTATPSLGSAPTVLLPTPRPPTPISTTPWRPTSAWTITARSTPRSPRAGIDPPGMRQDRRYVDRTSLLRTFSLFRVSQPDDGTATASTVISSGVPDPLTDKTCREGV